MDIIDEYYKKRKKKYKMTIGKIYANGLCGRKKSDVILGLQLIRSESPLWDGRYRDRLLFHFYFFVIQINIFYTLVGKVDLSTFPDRHYYK